MNPFFIATIFIILMFIITIILLKTQKALHEQRIKNISNVEPMTDYIKFISNFKKAEEYEKTGNKDEAVKHYTRALENLNRIRNKDELVLENIKIVESRLKKLLYKNS